MNMRRAVLLLAALLVSGVMAAGAAGASPRQDQPPTFGNDDDYTALCIPLTLSSASVSPGDTIHVSGTAATGGATIAIVLNQSEVLATVVSDPTNHFFAADVVIPADAVSGSIQAFQLGDNTDPIVGCPASVAGLTIVRTPTPAPLPSTGSNHTLPMTRAGVGLVAIGGLLVLASRRRRHTFSAAAA